MWEKRGLDAAKVPSQIGTLWLRVTHLTPGQCDAPTFSALN